MNSALENFCKRIDLRYCVIERKYDESKKWHVTAKPEYVMPQFAHRFTISANSSTGFNNIGVALAFAQQYEDTVDQIQSECC